MFVQCLIGDALSIQGWFDRLLLWVEINARLYPSIGNIWIYSIYYGAPVYWDHHVVLDFLHESASIDVGVHVSHARRSDHRLSYAFGLAVI